MPSGLIALLMTAVRDRTVGSAAGVGSRLQAGAHPAEFSDALDLPLMQRDANGLAKVLFHLGQPDDVRQRLLLGSGV